MTRIEVPNSSPRRGSSRRGGRVLVSILVAAVIGLALWTWLTLAWSYADGERAGLLQKFTRRGWLCKTEEGELAQYNIAVGAVVSGVAPQLWVFSVRDEATAGELRKAVGHRVQLHYTEHPGVPTSCFADTRYYVDRVTVVDGSPAAPNAAPGAAH
jgi:hypothetical protein